MTRIVNGSTFEDGEFRAGLEILIEDGLIADVDSITEPCETFDATGLYVTPGFIDAHIHGFGGRDMMEGKDAVLTMSRELVKHGTTSFAPTTMTASVEETRSANIGVAEAMKENTDGATILGTYMEGPFFCMKRKGAQPAEHIASPTIEAFQKMEGGTGVVKRLALAPELDGAIELIRYLVANGVQVSLGHSDATYEQVMEAVANGASSITHLYNAQTPLTHREPGVVGAGLSCGQLTTEFISDLVHIHKGALKIMYAAKGSDLCCAITDSMMAGGMPDGDYTLGGQPVISKDGAARLADGTLAGSILTLRNSLRNMVESVGVPLEKAIPMYTSTPARLLGQYFKRGKIEVGYIADIIAFDRSYNIKAAWVGGKRLV